MRRALVWFRQDLRIHDNEAFIDAMESADEVFGVYVFDSRTFRGKTSFGFPKTGAHRARFIIEAVADLKRQFQVLGSDLIIRIGHPEDELFALAKSLRTSWVFCNRERTQEEVEVQEHLEKKLWSIGQEVRFSRGKMLYYTADLPYPVTHVPDFFTQFRKETEHITAVRQPLPAVTGPLTALPAEVNPGVLPQLSDFHLTAPEYQWITGGEEAGNKRLQAYLWETGAVSHYKETRNDFAGDFYSSQLSPYLAQGCLSPKTIYWEVKNYESQREANESTYALTYELLWRDFFRLMGKKHGNRIFQRQGIREKPVTANLDWEVLEQWIAGKTGVPIIDANMRYFRHTGFLSNRGRQLVASFLIHDLELDWLAGAEYFESQLIDYDPCSNYGNWQYLAGVGTDMREDRYFNIYSQARRYDPQGDFVREWVPELSALTSHLIHLPDQLDPDVLQSANIRLGIDYPLPGVDTERWL
ncbi:MAG: DASH family cryptochrome [Saprospiraceae bacterium]